MTITSKVKAMLGMSGKKQIELAAHFGMMKQSMQNKMVRDAWSAKDLAKVAEFCDCKLVILTPDGGQLFIDPD